MENHKNDLNQRQSIRAPDIGVGKGGERVKGFKKFVYGFKAYIAASALLGVLAGIILLFMDLDSTVRGMCLLMGIVSLAVFIFVVSRYLRKIPEDMKKSALTGFLIYGLILFAAVTMIFAFIPIGIIIFSHTVNRYYVVDDNGIVYYVKRY